MIAHRDAVGVVVPVGRRLSPMSADAAVDDAVLAYLELGLAFDAHVPGFVDAFVGDPALRRRIADAPTVDARVLADRAAGLTADLASVPGPRATFLRAQLAGLHCSARKLAGDEIGFVDEVRAYFDVDVAPGDQAEYAAAHRRLDDLLDGSGPLVERYTAYRARTRLPADRLPEIVDAFASALRDRVRAEYPLDPRERVEFEIVGDKPWSGFNYYLGAHRSRVAINADLPQYAATLPHLIAHEAYPGHHTEHSRKETLLLGGGQPEQAIFLVNTPQCLMAEGLADHALGAIVGPGWGAWAQEIYADLGLRVDGAFAEAVESARAGLLGVRQDAVLLLHDRHADTDDVVAYLRRWLLTTPEAARQSLRFFTDPLWRAYISTYVEGYRLLSSWLDAVPDNARAARFGRLLDEPLTPGALRSELPKGESR